MVNSALQVVGFVLSIIAFILVVATCALPTWRKSDIRGEVIETIVRTSGLWARCTHQATGQYACDDYDTFFLGLPASLQAARATTCLSIATSFIGMILGVLGLSCTNVASGNTRMKAKMVVAGGFFMIVAGAAIGIAVSWYASEVLQEYNSLIAIGSQPGTRYVYGEALFIGWSGMVIAIIAGAVMCCSSWNAEDEDSGHSYHYNPPKPSKAAAEYI